VDLVSIIFSLLIVYQVKHFVADYPLQGEFMLGKFKPGWDFLPPLIAHAGVHGIFTLCICLYINPALWWLSIIDFSAHFIMDRIKAGPKYLGRYKSLSAFEFKKVYDTYIHAENITDRLRARKRLRDNVLFWWALGFDQMIHHITHYFVIYVLVMDIIL
jgi:hypothetical protein